MAIYARIGERARRAALARTGRDPGDLVVLDLSGVDEVTRQTIAGAARADRVRDSRTEDLVVEVRDAADTTAEAIAAAVREAAAQREREEAERRAREERKRREIEEYSRALARLRPEDLLLEEYRSSQCGSHGYHPAPYLTVRLPLKIGEVERPYCSPTDLAPEARAVYERAMELERRARAEAEARVKAACEAETKRDEERARERAAWIAAHGSQRLRALVREGIEHDRLYRGEWLSATYPGWIYASTVCGDLEEPVDTSVTDEALAALEAARKSHPQAKISLSWLSTGRRADHLQSCPASEGDECEAEPRLVLAAEVTVPGDRSPRAILKEIA